jgi:hypothetical protein
VQAARAFTPTLEQGCSLYRAASGEWPLMAQSGRKKLGSRLRGKSSVECQWNTPKGFEQKVPLRETLDQEKTKVQIQFDEFAYQLC